MSRNVVEAELHCGSTRVRVQTYNYDVPSEQVRCPSQHLLTLMSARRRHTSRSYFGRPQSSNRYSLGNLLYVPAGHPIWGSGPGGPLTMVTCTFPKGSNEALAMFEQGWDDHALSRFGDIRSNRIVEAMRRLGQEALEPGFGSDILVDALTSMLPVELVRHFEGLAMRGSAIRGGLAPHQLRAIEDHVRAWPAGGVRVSDLAALTGLSRGHFMRAFKQSTGKTVHNFVEDVRLDHAKSLLIDSDKPLKQIAAMLGFANPASFSLAFRRMTGEAPGRYRNMRQGVD
ncbi:MULTISPECIES: helix-turn-helix domain-containing protein [Sphingomonadales]|uniref:AraC family transcriptional regulator n=2 Tax=Edaphosphingomonas TaxID=3423724 RepID=A0A2T4I6W5_9SPHN|nr:MULTISPECIES: AraC family transcriptional regulator [Sphingomonas]AGH50889.1 AraC family transcriptional regulator [Sphingomonas sp. MM-1]MDX3886333.1 AraC family transcriptional regulator [Sphingomonas sp.]OHT19314.1 Xylose operon regulatory protein [Sphingomonas haloaromaticamans]PTD26473.1 AraC family transcriptional regulator [Sphingomonas fennica]